MTEREKVFFLLKGEEVKEKKRKGKMVVVSLGGWAYKHRIKPVVDCVCKRHWSAVMHWTLSAERFWLGSCLNFIS